MKWRTEKVKVPTGLRSYKRGGFWFVTRCGTRGYCAMFYGRTRSDGPMFVRSTARAVWAAMRDAL